MAHGVLLHVQPAAVIVAICCFSLPYSNKLYIDSFSLSTAMASHIGIPIKLLNEAQGHVVTLEITTGQTYRGKLLEGAYDPSPPSQSLCSSSNLL